MNIDEKIKIFEISCQRMLSEDATKLSNSINDEVENQIKSELEDYERKEEITYNKKIEKMEKEYNKQIYSTEVNNKKEILEEKDNIYLDIKEELEKRLKEFTETNEYKEFLIKKIDEAMTKVKANSDIQFGMLDKDCKKYGDEIYNRYHVFIKQIDDKYIGGCIVEDKTNGIYIDNTLKNSIEEKLER